MLTKKEIDLWEVEDLLKRNNLKVPSGVSYTVGVFEGETLVGTGSLDKGIIKGMAIDVNYQGRGILNTIISDLIGYGAATGQTEFFIFTSSCNGPKLENFGFKEIIAVDGIGFYEKSMEGIEAFKNKLSKMKVENSSAIVMNANPFTLGHLALVEKAARESKHVFLFTVEEDQSIFPFSVRYHLIKAGVGHLKNVEVIPSGRYIISSLVFPTYFIKGGNEVEIHAKVDLTIFSEHIARTLGIVKRYVGSEPFCEVTNKYNEIMKTILPEADIEVVEMEREKVDGHAISATKVRRAMIEGDKKTLKALLPETTVEFLRTKEGQWVIEKLKKTYSDDYVNCKS